jgi:hypothetical protein
MRILKIVKTQISYLLKKFINIFWHQRKANAANYISNFIRSKPNYDRNVSFKIDGTNIKDLS